MIDARLALKTILSFRLPSRTSLVSLEDSLSRCLAEDIFSDADQPPFNRVAMDGIAVNKATLLHSIKYKILKTVSAGSEVCELPAGQVCFEVMTGAVLPVHADLVIRYEDLKISEGFAEINCEISKLTSNFHPKGSDYRKGDKVLSAGGTIKSTTTAILASVGKTQVRVFDLPRIAVLSTGDELVDIGEVPLPHQIRWSNGISLKHLLLTHRFTDVTLHKVRDDEGEIKAMIQALLTTKDVLLITGGVSAGKFDYVPKLLRECQVEEIFHKVAQRPGKPLWFGKTATDAFVFGLPGNPVSCLVNLLRFVIPFMSASVPGAKVLVQKAFLLKDVLFTKKLTYYCLSRFENRNGKIVATPVDGNGSGDFFQLEASDGFIELRPEDGPFKEGFLGEIFSWRKTHE